MDTEVDLRQASAIRDGAELAPVALSALILVVVGALAIVLAVLLLAILLSLALAVRLRSVLPTILPEILAAVLLTVRPPIR